MTPKQKAQKKYVEKNRAKIKEYQAKYYQEHKEELKIKKQIYRDNNKDKVKIWNRNSYLKRKGNICNGEQ